MILNFSTIAYASPTTLEAATIDGRKFKIGNERVEARKELQPVEAESFSLSIVSNRANLSLKLDGKQMKFEILLLPSQFAIYKGNTIVGVSENVSAEYRIASFRIEREAFEIGLMEENLKLANKTVLFLGIEDVIKKETSYFQVQLSFDFDSVYNAVNNCYSVVEYTPSDLEKLEISYLTLSSVSGDENSRTGAKQPAFTATYSGTSRMLTPNNESGYNEVDNLSDTIEQIKNATRNGFIRVNDDRSRSLINGVPDDVYKSGTLDVWKKSLNPWTTKSGYAVYPMQYAGTQNRLHYVITYGLSQIINYNSQYFDMAYRVTQNCWVLYNVINDEVSIHNSQARAAVDVTLSYYSSSEEGVFTRRYYTIVKADTIVDIATRIVIGYFPSASAASILYETLTNSSDITKDREYPYADNYDAQANEGKIVQRVSVYAEGLRKIDDYLYLRLRGDAIYQVDYSFSYTAYDPLT